MGRLILLLFIIIVIVLLWRAFGPGAAARRGGGTSLSGPSWGNRRGINQQSRPIAPDDDPEFLWKLKKAEFDRRKREQERRNQQQPPQSGENEDKGEPGAGEPSQSD